MDEQVEKCIICTEMLKSWLSEKPIYKGSDCSKVYQWNKIGEVRIKPENKLEVDRYSPVLEIILSLQPFEEGQFNDRSVSTYGSHVYGFFSVCKHQHPSNYLRLGMVVKTQVSSLSR